MITLGLDIGSNSVGSAWIDTDKREITLGVSVFPAGVDETEDKRGAPKNQERRAKRSLRRTLARRSQRKRQTRRLLTKYGLLPADADQLRELFNLDPWELRRCGLDEPLTAHEFGRVLVHLNQRRGALGLKLPDPDENSDDKADQKAKDEARVKGAVEHTKQLMHDLGAHTFGELMAMESERRTCGLLGQEGKPRLDKNSKPKTFQIKPIRNRLDSFEFHADRSMIRDEFLRLCKRQLEPDGALSHLDEKQREHLKQVLDDPDRVLYDRDPSKSSKQRQRYKKSFRHGGLLFGQRDTYWDTGTLGRCDLEPSDHCVPIADRHASYYRVLETVNNLRIETTAPPGVPLTVEQHHAVVGMLRGPLFKKRKGVIEPKHSASVTDIRDALGLKRGDRRKLNIERDEKKDINTDWFHREIVHGAIGEDTWNQWPEAKQEGLNRAILKCDPAIDDDTGRLLTIAKNLDLDDEASQQLITAWKTRPKLEKRLNLSRRAILNLLPYMCDAFVRADRKSGEAIQWWWLKDRAFDPAKHRWPTQIEARQMFAEDGATDEQRRRYRIGAQTLTKADRHFLAKHPYELPPAPMLSNPVVRKAIHEVRRHIIAHIRAHGGTKPDRIAIEFVREAKKPKKLSDWILALNRKRDQIGKKIIEEIIGDAASRKSHNQVQRTVDRVILARQQKWKCAYCGQCIGDPQAALGNGLEIDHIIPQGRCPNHNAWSNRVLCHQTCNQTKRKQTPREWWGKDFDDRIRPMAFMDGYEPDKGDPNEYFTKSDYAAKWKNFNREDVPKQWRGSQLTDTAYAARQVQTYLQSALWPDEPSHVEGGQGRRIFVTKGPYTHQLRKDWRLFQNLIDPSRDSREEVQEASAKDRGDHREHAVDAVAIAFIAQPGSVRKQSGDRPTTLLDDLAHFQQKIEEERLQAKMEGRDPSGLKRKPLPPLWGTVAQFRRQVMSMIYGEFDELGDGGKAGGSVRSSQPIVVSHRTIGRRIIGAFHEDTLFGPLPNLDNKYVGRTWIYKDAKNRLKPAHLRVPEGWDDLSAKLEEANISKHEERALRRQMGAMPDPNSGKSGIIRDRDLRDQIRKCLRSHSIDPDDFTAAQIKALASEGKLTMTSGVPIKRVKLLRTMTDPVVTHRKKWDHQQQKWVRDTGKDADLKPDQRSRADRAYVGGNNHHIEIREDEKGKWSGVIVPMFDAARRVRIEKRHAVDRSDDPKKGRFIMSLAEGETVYMKHPETGKSDYFVVFKLDKPQTIHFKYHWDGRPDKGKKDDEGNLIPNSAREDVGRGIPASKLRDLAPCGHETPVKVRVSPLGEVQPLERD